MSPLHADSLYGKQLDEYRLEDLLGRGGMARVYRALDVRLNRYVAIKVIDTPFRSDAAYLRRFEREAQAIGRLEHPNVVRLYRYGDVITDDDAGQDEPAHLLYMAMQYVQGATLAAVLDSYRRDGEFIPPEDALRISGEMAQALDYVHAQGIIHRDVKPSNILLSREGESSSYHAMLTDFGLALLDPLGTRGETFGTPHYIAPEQARSSAKAVPQSDLYSLGVILYEMFTGQLPFNAQEAMEIALQHLHEAPPPPRAVRPELSPEVEAVILKALAKAPEQRYPTGQALHAALVDAVSARPFEPAPRVSLPERVTESTQNRLPPLPGIDTAGTEATLPPAVPDTLSTLPAPRPVAGAAPRRDWQGASVSGERPVQSERSVPQEQPIPPAPPAAVPGGQRQSPSRRPRRWLLLGALAGVLLLLACLTAGVLAVRGLLNRAGATARATQPGAFPVLETATSAPEASPAASSAASTAGAHTYTFQLSRCKEQGCLVVKNTGTEPIPLNSLTLRGGPVSLNGGEWGISQLMPGACVKAVKDESAYDQLPDGVTCTAIAGHPLMREGSERFWNNTITATLLDITAGTCPKNATKCTLNVVK